MELKGKEKIAQRMRLNPKTQLWEAHDVLVGYKFDNLDRIEIIREFFESKVTLATIEEQYKITKTQFENWVGKYFIQETEEMASEKQQTGSSKQDLEKELRRLRKALKAEKLRSELLSTMIDLAENQFNIPIRKKHGTKQ